jgi:Abi-like protein
MLSDFNQYLFKLTSQETAAILASISRERLTTYLSVCSGERDALTLYECNAQLSKHIYDLVGGFEVALRNRVSSSIIDHYQREDWYRSRIFLMLLAKERRQNIAEVRKRLKIDKRQERSGRVVAGLTFHFWVSLHENKYRDSIWTPHLHRVWPKGENLKRVHKDLLKIRDLRNRIAHHEPIFKDQWHNRVSVICERFSQLSPEKAAWYDARLQASISHWQSAVTQCQCL